MIDATTPIRDCSDLSNCLSVFSWLISLDALYEANFRSCCVVCCGQVVVYTNVWIMDLEAVVLSVVDRWWFILVYGLLCRCYVCM